MGYINLVYMIYFEITVNIPLMDHIYIYIYMFTGMVRNDANIHIKIFIFYMIVTFRI
jgi:hypothetical protein